MTVIAAAAAVVVPGASTGRLSNSVQNKRPPASPAGAAPESADRGPGDRPPAALRAKLNMIYGGAAGPVAADRVAARAEVNEATRHARLVRYRFESRPSAPVVRLYLQQAPGSRPETAARSTDIGGD